MLKNLYNRLTSWIASWFAAPKELVIEEHLDPEPPVWVNDLPIEERERLQKVIDERRAEVAEQTAVFEETPAVLVRKPASQIPLHVKYKGGKRKHVR